MLNLILMLAALTVPVELPNGEVVECNMPPIEDTPAWPNPAVIRCDTIFKDSFEEEVERPGGPRS